MLETIGFLELNSIAKGVEAADLILKTAEVDLIFAKAGCPGKYYILFTGEVAAVKASLDAGAAIGGNHTVDSCVIPRVHPQVIKAINLAAEPGTPGAIGVMEFFSVTASVYAADAAVKAADVDLIDGNRYRREILRRTDGRSRGSSRSHRMRYSYGERRRNGSITRGDSKPTQRNFRFAFIGDHGRSGG